jgi:hypothetical protein
MNQYSVCQISVIRELQSEYTKIWGEKEGDVAAARRPDLNHPLRCLLNGLLNEVDVIRFPEFCRDLRMLGIGDPYRSLRGFVVENKGRYPLEGALLMARTHKKKLGLYELRYKRFAGET